MCATNVFEIVSNTRPEIISNDDVDILAAIAKKIRESKYAARAPEWLKNSVSSRGSSVLP